MAEIALVAAVIPKLITLLDGEVQLHRNIRSDLESIKRELECIKDFLIAADASEEECWEDDVWVGQVREVAFESEDIVDDFMLHFARDHLDGSSCSFCLISMIKNGKGQHDIATRMKDIRAKFVEIRQGNGRYRTEDFKHAISNSAGKSRWHNPQRDVLLLSQDELVGMQKHERNLIDKLVTGNNASMSVVSVLGMGGVGKTSLVKKVYDNADLRSHFQGQVWITVSRTFDPEDVLKDLIHSLYEEAMHQEPEELEKMRSREKVTKILRNMTWAELQQKARELLGEKMYLIVFDDVWSINAWNSIRSVFPTTFWVGQIVITTQNMATALAACRGQSNLIYELKQLSEDESLDLFYTKIFGSPNSCPDHLDKVSKSILKKCAGLPLAIVAIAGVLVSKDVTAQSDEWGRIDISLRKEFEGTQKVLSLSYNDLPHELKPCFLYLSIFPEDYLIERMRLIRLWIAEGFVERGNCMTQEEVAESYLDELIGRSLIQVVDRTSDGRVKTFRIHDLLREMITKKAMDQKFAATAREYNNLRSVKMRRLSLSSNLEILQHNRCLGQLRSLFMFSLEQPVTKSSMPALFSKEFSFKLLTVLDLQGTILDKFPSTIMKLKNLKYLNLSHTDVKEVPSSIGRLRKLESLDLRSTLVSELPKEILKLQRLRDLVVYRLRNGVIHGVRAPAGIQGLRSLENLCYIDASKYSGIAAEELAQVHLLGVTNFSNKIADVVCSDINKLRCLRVLSMSSWESEAMDLHDLVSPSNSLRRLFLSGKLESLPQWLESMHNLVIIYLKSSKLQDDPVDILGQLPNLVHMELSESYTGAEMRFRAGHFQKLKVMGLSNFTYIEKVIFENEAMPNLERLIMKNNKLLKIVPSGIEKLCKLRELNFVDMPFELGTAIRGCNGQEGTEYEKIKHIGEVYWVYKVENSWKTESLVISAGRSKDKRKSKVSTSGKPKEMWKSSHYDHIL
ncbi:unnamed protein product [Rhodiola kirilowii]